LVAPGDQPEIKGHRRGPGDLICSGPRPGRVRLQPPGVFYPAGRFRLENSC
jgi:hypothetical protein